MNYFNDKLDELIQIKDLDSIDIVIFKGSLASAILANNTIKVEEHIIPKDTDSIQLSWLKKAISITMMSIK